MGAFYFHDNKVLLSAGYCPDGMERIQPLPKADAILVMGEPPCDLQTLAADEVWSITEGQVVRRAIPVDEMWQSIRFERDQRLLATDWLELRALREQRALEPDWSSYRQALRDITNQPDPYNIDWPEAPAARNG